MIYIFGTWADNRKWKYLLLRTFTYLTNVFSPQNNQRKRINFCKFGAQRVRAPNSKITKKNKEQQELNE